MILPCCYSVLERGSWNFSWKQGKNNNNNKKGLEWGAEKLLLLPFDLRNKVVVTKWGLAVRLRSAIEANCFFFKVHHPEVDTSSVCVSFLSFLSFLLIVTGCYLPFSLLISTEHSANINIYFRQCFSVSCMLDRSSWCDLYAVIVRCKLFLSVRCLGWWISIFKKIPRCWQPQLTREDCAEGFGLACL